MLDSKLLSSITLTIFITLLFCNNSFGDVHSCKGDDKECIMQMLQNILGEYAKGNRDWNLVQLDPLRIKVMILERHQSSPVNVELKFKDIEMTGLSGCKIDRLIGFDADPKTSSFEIYGVIPKLKFTGPYSVDGKVLILPIVGKGNCKLIFENMKITIKLDTKTVQKNGQTHLQIKSASIDLIPSKSIFHLENLFNGDKALGDNMNKFINENWQEIFNELKPAVSKAIGLVLTQIVNGPLAKIPYTNMILP